MLFHQLWLNIIFYIYLYLFCVPTSLIVFGNRGCCFLRVKPWITFTNSIINAAYGYGTPYAATKHVLKKTSVRETMTTIAQVKITQWNQSPLDYSPEGKQQSFVSFILAVFYIIFISFRLHQYSVSDLKFTGWEVVGIWSWGLAYWWWSAAWFDIGSSQW